MKTNLKSILFIFITTFAFSSCELIDLLAGDLNDSYSAAKNAASDNYIFVNSSQMQIDSSNAGKTAYLVKVNSGRQTDLADTGYAYSYNKYLNEETKPYCGFKNVYFDKGKIVSGSARAASSRTLKTYSLGETKQFFASTSKNSRARKTATLKAIGEHCYVWYIPSSKPFIDESKMPFKTLAEKFDSVYQKETEIFGKNQATVQYDNIINISSRDRVHFLVYDLENSANKDNTSSGTYGFSDSMDLYENEYYSNGDITSSNELQILHLNSWLFQNNPEAMYSTTAHEFQHLLQFIQKYINNNTQTATWFNEMLSMVAEEIFQQTLEIKDEYAPLNRLYHFDVGTYFGFAEECWNYMANNGGTGSYDYANTYAFGSYLLHNYGGIPLIHEMATNSYIDENAISKALESLSIKDSNGNGNNENFMTVVYKFGQVVANADGKDASLKTLNNYVSDITYGIIKPINLSSFSPSLFTEFYMTNDEYIHEKNIPIIYNSDAGTSLYQYGFSVHYLGKISRYGETFYISLPKDRDVAMYILLKE